MPDRVAPSGSRSLRWSHRSEAFRTYRVHDVDITVRADDPGLLDPVHAVLEHLGLGTTAGERSAPIAIRVCTDTAPSTLHAGRVVAHLGDLTGVEPGDGSLWLSCPGYRCHLHPSGDEGTWVIPPDTAAVRKDIISYALLLSLRRRGLYGLHASGAALGGEGILFVARSGGGKSTLTYSLVRQGWEYLGDDAVLLRHARAGVESLALRRDLCLDPALRRVFPEVGEHGVGGPFAGRGKRRLDMAGLYPHRLIDAVMPRALVFPEICRQPRSTLVPVDASEMVARLSAQSIGIGMEAAIAPRHVEVLGRLAMQVRGYRLSAGSDLKGDPAAVEALLERHGVFSRTGNQP